MRYFFAGLDEKRKLLRNFEKILNFLMKILQKNSIFLFLFFQKLVIKNRAFGNNTIFLQQFFRVRGGDFSPFPLAALLGGRTFSTLQVVLCRTLCQTSAFSVSDKSCYKPTASPVEFGELIYGRYNRGEPRRVPSQMSPGCRS